MVTVPGKITIVDFWATWCQPCKALEVELVALATRHPGRVAIRKIDVVDLESPVAMTYLAPGKFDLPHVKVYDARGALILEQTPGPGKLPALVEELARLVSGGR